MKRKSKRPSKLATAAATVKQAATVDKLLDTLPLIAPIPTAYAIGAAMQIKLRWPDPVTIIAAVAIEAAGFVAADTAAKYYEFNRTAKDDETKAPAWMAYAALGFYVCVTLGMTFLYEPLAMVFPLLSAVGFWLFVLRKDQTSRAASREADRATAKAEHEKVLEGRREKRRTAKESKQGAAQVQEQIPQPVAVLVQSVAPAAKWPRKCEHCEAVLSSPQAVGGHMKKNHPELCKRPALAVELFQGAKK